MIFLTYQFSLNGFWSLSLWCRTWDAVYLLSHQNYSWFTFYRNAVLSLPTPLFPPTLFGLPSLSHTTLGLPSLSYTTLGLPSLSHTTLGLTTLSYISLCLSFLPTLQLFTLPPPHCVWAHSTLPQSTFNSPSFHHKILGSLTHSHNKFGSPSLPFKINLAHAPSLGGSIFSSASSPHITFTSPFSS